MEKYFCLWQTLPRKGKGERKILKLLTNLLPKKKKFTN